MNECDDDKIKWGIALNQVLTTNMMNDIAWCCYV